MATFNNLEINKSYMIIDPKTGYPLTTGISGADAMSDTWPRGAEAWSAKEESFRGDPLEIAR
jgi:tRNA(Ile2) C34 agmatinyltransferase TiaS